MKKVNMVLVFLLIGIQSFSQTTATNFNSSDCAGNNHDLFAELNSGKVIVLDWVMPCASCLIPSKTAYNIVQTYATTNPGKVVMYICDDYANTNCTSLSSWVDGNAMPNTVKFSNNIIKMTNYGVAGMPKIIVMGGINHTIYFNEINTASGNSTKLQDAIKSALAAASIPEKPVLSFSSLNLFPNPAVNSSTISLTLINPSEVTIELFDYVGQKVTTVLANEKLSQGENKINFSTQDIANGFYFIKVSDGSGYKILRFSVNH